MKSAMKEKNQAKLAAVRAIKAEILKEQTSGKGTEVTDADVLKLIQKMIKQRTDSIAIYQQQGRQDLVDEENAQLEYIKCYLPKQLSEAEVEEIIAKVVAETGATSIKDMGKVMGAANKALAGQSDGRTISTIVKKLLA
jgi:uncharacterized protein YqeY